VRGVSWLCGLIVMLGGGVLHVEIGDPRY